MDGNTYAGHLQHIENMVDQLILEVNNGGVKLSNGHIVHLIKSISLNTAEPLTNQGIADALKHLSYRQEGRLKKNAALVRSAKEHAETVVSARRDAFGTAQERSSDDSPGR